METTTSFAPLAARLAAQVEKMRPAHGTRNDMAKVVALLWCLVFAMLIALCEALDARTATVARAVAVSPACDTTVRPVPAPRPAQAVTPRAGRMLRLVQADNAQPVAPKRDALLAWKFGVPLRSTLPAWAPLHPTPCWRPPQTEIFRRKEAMPCPASHVYFVVITKRKHV